jgi:hypothetical protein
LTAYGRTLTRVDGRSTSFQEASNVYEEPMSWVELSEKAFRMTHRARFLPKSDFGGFLTTCNHATYKKVVR